MNRIHIRLANEQDLEVLCNLYYEFHEFHARGVSSRLQSQGARDHQDWSCLRQALLDIFQDENATLFLVEVSGTPVGLVEAYLRQDDESNPLIVPHKYGYVQSLLVLEPFRRHGLGKQLMATAQHWAKEKGAAEVRLDVWEFEGGPFPFYEKLGYRTLKRQLILDL